MNFRLNQEENLNEGIIGVGTKLTVQAINHIHKNKNPHTSVHEVRKRFKEIRALLRLVRDDIGKEAYKKNNHFYRNEGRRISDLRDGMVYTETVKSFKEQYEGKLYKNAFSKTEIALEQQLSILVEELNPEQILQEIKENLKKHKKVVANWPVKAKSFEDIEQSLKRVYKRGYKMLGKVKDDPTVENLHEWRKRAKYMRYQIEFLRLIWPPMMKTHEKMFDNLGDLLGDDHDLATLLHNLEKNIPDEEEYNLIKAIAKDKRADLQKEAINLGEKIYSEKPKAFVKRLANYWRAHATSYPDTNKIPQ